MSLTPSQERDIVFSLLDVDDPFYLNNFANPEEEDRWFRRNKGRIQQDLQRYMPPGIDARDPDVWAIFNEMFRYYHEP